ncbi:MAG: hypothetical protein PWP23_1345 [Candidatus Sumerlaeota bacterium]|nr:hypothetical protein [Candidatus Sumerlaeota bacterium]
MADGVDVRLDKWDLKEGDDKYVFMEGLVNDPQIDKVLCFCDKGYAKKADDRKGGVGTEAQILTPELYKKTKGSRIVPIACEIDEDGEPCLPTFFEPRIYIDFSNEERFEDEYEKLLRLLFDRPLHRKPNIGRPPEYLFEEEPRRSITANRLMAFKNDLETGKKSAKGKARAFLRSYAEALKQIRTLKPEEGKEPDEVVIDAINGFEPVRQDYLAYVQHVIDFEDDPSLLLMIRKEWEEVLRRRKDEPEGIFEPNWERGAIQFVMRDALTTLIAMLIDDSKFDWADTFLTHRYDLRYYTDETPCYYSELETYIRVLEDWRNKRLNLNRASLVADLQKDWAERGGIDFEKIMQADLILTLRALFLLDGRWFPRTLAYTGRTYRPMPLFALAEDEGHFSALKALLHVESWGDFSGKMETAYLQHNLKSWRIGIWGLNWGELTNLKNQHQS